MASAITARFTPTAQRYGDAWNLGNKAYDGNLETYASSSVGASHPGAFTLDLSSIPAGSVITKVTYRYTLYRTDNASYCALRGAMGYADAGTSGSSGTHRVTDWQDIPLTGYKSTEQTATEQAISPAQSAQILSGGTPLLYAVIQNNHRVYEIGVDITYEPAASNLYVGDKKASAVYVGDKKATAVYLGTKRIL